jgi:phosphoribosylanthranilate isomerase
MTLVKICGITNLDDALSAVGAGADALGFNFYPPSRRYISPAAARGITDRLPDKILTVGVFVNEDSPDTVERLATEAGVTAVQLHGDESPQFCSALRDRYIIKVLAIDSSFDPQQALAYNVEAFMVDAFDRKARGGTGRTIDWSEARRFRTLVPKLFLAGGLSPENVSRAISTVAPYAVDACSALESSPGKKDPERVRAFVRACHES